MQIVVFMFLSQTWLNQHVIIRQEWYSGLVSRCTKANMRQSSLSSNPLQKKKEKKRKANRQTSISVSLNCSCCSMKTTISHHTIKQSLRHAPNECNFYTEWKILMGDLSNKQRTLTVCSVQQWLNLCGLLCLFLLHQPSCYMAYGSLI